MTSLPVRLPSGFTPLVQEGDTVTIAQPLARRVLAKEIFLNIPALLHCNPAAIKTALLKKPGDTVLKGDVLAEKQTVFSKKLIRSNVTGTITRYERSTGSLILRVNETPEYTSTLNIQEGESQTDESGEAVEELLRSPLDGLITLCDNEQIVIKTDKNVLSSEAFSGTKVQGTLNVLARSQSEAVSASDISTDIIDSVLLGGQFSREVLQKALGMDVLGIIGTDISDSDMAYFTQKQMQTPLLRVSEEVYGTLKRWGGKPVFIDGATGAIVLLTV